jgi:hypothetical protein
VILSNNLNIQKNDQVTEQPEPKPLTTALGRKHEAQSKIMWRNKSIVGVPETVSFVRPPMLFTLSMRPCASVFIAARVQRGYLARHLDTSTPGRQIFKQPRPPPPPLPTTKTNFVAPRRKAHTAQRRTRHCETTHTTPPTRKARTMGRITCSECDFDGCRDSCLDDHKRDFACHNKLCPLHTEYSVALRDGRLLRRRKRASSRRRESEDLPRRSSSRPRHTSRRPRSSSRRRSGGDRLFTRFMDGMLPRRETTSVDNDDDNKGRRPSISARIRRGTRHVRPEDGDDNGGPGPSTSARIRRGTRHVRPEDDNDNGGPGPSTSARIRRGTRYVRPQDDSDSEDSDSEDSDTEDSDSDERGERWKSAARPSSSRQYTSNSSTRPAPPTAGYSGYGGSSRRRSPGPSNPRPPSYPSGGNNSAGTSSYSGRNDRGSEYGARDSSRAPSPPLKTNWGHRS